jgi:hypothetical protein
MDPNAPADPTDLDPLLRNASGPDEDADAASAATGQDPERFSVRSEWSMVRVSKKRWFGR